MTRFLFVHNNLPAQFGRLMEHLASDRRNVVKGVGAHTAKKMKDIEIVRYRISTTGVSAVHPFARRFEVECRRAEQVLYAIAGLKASGFEPDIVVVHPGWGEAIPLREIFPAAKIVCYCEFYYGADESKFDDEFPKVGVDGRVGVSVKNAATLLALTQADRGVAPTNWQKSVFPEIFRSRIEVVHDGIMTDEVIPNPNASIDIGGLTIGAGSETITYVARNLEPYRGFHIFMRSIVRVLKARPAAQVVIVGGDGVSYGRAPIDAVSWKARMLRELKDELPLDRVHFLGRVPYRTYLAILQVSAVHIYLTYPFVLSWSLLEAMSAGCLVIGSDTAPVQEVITHKANGLLVPLFDIGAIAEQTIECLEHPERFAALRVKARETAVGRYDFTKRCLPQHLKIFDELMASGESPGEAGAVADDVIPPFLKSRRTVKRKRTR
ncbi:MAG: glycosyltransferase [Xanthobacteraceae bacterium]|nr:glycosyltransferase [Xanthobacteraceae bacterium]